MTYDPAVAWQLWFFGACGVGLLVGFAVGAFAGFRVGLGIGLLIAGGASLAWIPTFVGDYRDFTAHPERRTGTVVAVEDRAVDADGDITTPVAVVEYTDAGGVRRRADSRAAPSWRVGESVIVVPEPGGGAGVHMGRVRDARGGAIAALLFGTFPFSAGLFFLATAAFPDAPSRAGARRAPAAPVSPFVGIATLVCFAGMLAPLVYEDTVERQLVLVFGALSLGLWLYVLGGVRMRAALEWTLGVGVLAVNFTVWTVALWLLARVPAEW